MVSQVGAPYFDCRGWFSLFRERVTEAHLRLRHVLAPLVGDGPRRTRGFGAEALDELTIRAGRLLETGTMRERVRHPQERLAGLLVRAELLQEHAGRAHAALQLGRRRGARHTEGLHHAESRFGCERMIGVLIEKIAESFARLGEVVHLLIGAAQRVACVRDKDARLVLLDERRREPDGLPGSAALVFGAQNAESRLAQLVRLEADLRGELIEALGARPVGLLVLGRRRVRAIGDAQVERGHLFLAIERDERLRLGEVDVVRLLEVLARDKTIGAQEVRLSREGRLRELLAHHVRRLERGVVAFAQELGASQQVVALGVGVPACDLRAQQRRRLTRVPLRERLPRGVRQTCV